MSEEEESTRGTGARRLLDFASNIAQILGFIWSVVGVPSIVVLLRRGTLSRIWPVLAWLLPTLLLWGLAWWRRRQLSRAVRQGYVCAVLWLGRPVRREVAERLGGETAAGVHEEMEALVEECDEHVLRTLLFALVEGVSDHDGPVYVIARQVFLYGVGEFTNPYLELEKACNKLVESGVAVTYRFDRSGGVAQIWIRRDIGEANETGQLSRLVREELKRRGA
jgi:hypothetical protein